MPNYVEMIRLHEAGFSLRQIAKLVSSGRNTVTRTVNIAQEKELSYEEIAQWSSEELENMFKPDKDKKDCKRQLYNVGNRQFKIVGFPTFFIYFSYPLFRNGGIRMRKDIREGVKKHMIDGIKPNYAALAKQYGCDYRTVKAAYHEALEGGKRPVQRKKRPSKLDPYKATIEEKLKDQCSAYSIFKFIEKKGFDGSYSLVKQYCRSFKQEKIKKATVRIEYTPGLSAQVDWKEEMKMISNQGEIFTFNIFLYILPYSKKRYITLTFDRKQDTLFSCLNDAFYYTGGVPEEIWFDNMKTVVDHSRTQFSKAQLNERFYAFSKDAGFRTMVCRPFRPQTKGSVEALARAVERLRVYNHEFYDSVDLIHIVNDLCEEMNSEVSQATNEIPNLRWEMNEKEHLHKLKKDLLKPYFEDFITRKVTNEAMVNFRQCKYSVDPRYIGKEIEVELSENEEHVHFYYNGERIRSHQITTKKLNYHQEDLVQILKSDVMSHKEEDEIQEHIRQSMKLYDLLEDETDE